MVGSYKAVQKMLWPALFVVCIAGCSQDKSAKTESSTDELAEGNSAAAAENSTVDTESSEGAEVDNGVTEARGDGEDTGALVEGNSGSVDAGVADSKLTPGGQPEIEGTLDKEIIRRVVRQHRNEIRFCHHKQLEKIPDLEGAVKVRFTISGTGSVTSADVVASELNNTDVENCMTTKIKKWTFPEPPNKQPVIVNYPFEFSL